MVGEPVVHHPGDVEVPHVVALLAAADELASHVGLGDAAAPDHDEAAATGAPRAGAVAEPAAPSAELALGEAVVGERAVEGPTAEGFFSRGGRVVMRVIRGQPRNSVSVRCYMHTYCSFLLPLRIAPSNAELVAWLLEGEELPPDANAARRRAAGDHHKMRAERFKSRPGPGASSAGLASSSAG